MILDRLPFATFFAVALAVVLGVYLHHLNPWILEVWLPAKCASSFARACHAFYLRRKLSNPNFRLRYDSLQWIRALVFVDGLIWGILGLALISDGNQHLITVIVCSLVGLASVSTFTLYAERTSMLLYIVPMTLPMALILMAAETSDRRIYGAGLLVLLCGLLFLGRLGHRQIKELLRLRFETDEMKRDAELRSEHKSRFIATMTHELRTPLHGILGLTDLAFRKSEQSDVRTLLNHAQQSGSHLLSLINAILDLSSIENGRMELNIYSVDLKELLEEMMAVSEVNALAKGLELDWSFHIPEPCVVQTDPTRLREVLHNLVGNAIKFTPKGQVRCQGFWTPNQANGGMLKIDVIDTGPGIPSDRLESIFSPYVRLQTPSGEEVSSGTGLGLTITRELAQALGGDVTCQSIVGRGSTFTLTLQLSNGNAAEVIPSMIPALSSIARIKDAPDVRLRGRILLAEDNEVNAIVAEALLSELGLTTEIVKDGAAVVNRLNPTLHPDQPTVDLVLMDCQMPIMDGYTATRVLRHQESQHHLKPIPVIALTANAMSDEENSCIDAGMNGYLSKPFNRQQLIAVLLPFMLPNGKARNATQPAASQGDHHQP